MARKFYNGVALDKVHTVYSAGHHEKYKSRKNARMASRVRQALKSQEAMVSLFDASLIIGAAVVLGLVIGAVI